MNTKILIETLTQIPDIELLNELEKNLKNTGSIVVPDLNKLFVMFTSIFKYRQKDVLFKSLLLLSQVVKTLLLTELQICWKHVGGEIVRICGAQDNEIRKKGREIFFQLLTQAKNSILFLQTIYEEGLQSENNLVRASSIQLIQIIFQEHTQLLQQKSNIPIIKLILQKLIRFTFKDQHSNLNQKSLDFLHALFYMNFSNLHEVLQRMDGAYLKAIEKIWQKNKNQLLYKYKTQEQKVQSIQYQHLPLIRDKIFGVYEPFVIKNLFSPQLKSARQYAVQQFQTQFLQNEPILTKYVNPITKIIIKLLPDRHQEVISLLAHILTMPGISNIINMSSLLSVLMPQLGDPSVFYRKQVRDCFQRLNATAKCVLQFYNNKLNEIDRNNEEYDWIQVYQLLTLVFHWVSVNQPGDCYPPALNDSIIFSFNKRQTKIPKIRQKCSQFLFSILEKYPSYRETLEQVLSIQQMGELQDQVQTRKNYLKLNQEHNKEAKQTFLQEYHQERNRYLHTHQHQE